MKIVHYRFVHLTSNVGYCALPATLRMRVIGNPGTDNADFKLFDQAVSAA